MSARPFDVVTGAFGYTGKYITRRLLAAGRVVKTLTGHVYRRNSIEHDVQIIPFNFDAPDDLTESLRGANTVYNTYWVRFPYRGVTFETAVANSKTLIHAARDAGVKRFVHVSIANPSEDSPLPYYRGKAIVERILADTGMSYAVIRPTVVFGKEDILINNIVWLLRKFPIFAIPGKGEYRVQPIYVEDLAELAVELGGQHKNVVVDAVGPEVFTFAELVRKIAGLVGSNARIVHVRPSVALAFATVIGWFLRDVTLTRQEVDGLIADLLVSKAPATGHTLLSDWLETNVDALGVAYASEVARHYR